MGTQTGSISFETSNGLKSYASSTYATLSQIKGQFAISNSSASSANKTATIIPLNSSWTLYSGATVTVKFENKNTSTSNSLTLNVNNTGAKEIKDYAGNTLQQSAKEWQDNTTMTLTYDGTNWRIQDTNLMEQVHSAQSSIEQTAASIVSLVSNQDYYIIPDGTTGENTIKSTFTQQANAIDARVEKDGVIAAINASVEEIEGITGSSLQIQADKVNIAGAAIFTNNGRLSETSLNNTYSPISTTTTLNNYITSNNATLQTLQNQIDGQIEAWYFSADPATTAYGATEVPLDAAAANWRTVELKDRHVGDLYYNVTTGHSWRWMKEGTDPNYTWKWLAIPDSDAAAALAAAQQAQNTANNKKRIFTIQPTGPYDVGDLWVNGSQVKYCTNSNATENSYNANDWALTATDDTTANTAVYRTQRIYCRTTEAQANLTGPTTWLSTSGTGYGNWSTSIPQLTNNGTKYSFLYTCTQTQTVAQAKNSGTTCTCSEVLLDNSTTIIDGGTIITGTVHANAINSSSGTFNTANIPDLNASKITAGDIAADRITTNLISAINAEVSDISALNATIGGFEIDDTSIHTRQIGVTSNADNSIALSSVDFTRTINNTSRSGLRFAMGDKFAVTGDGTVYASGITISESQVAGLTGDLIDAKKHTQVIVSANNINYLAAGKETAATLTATLYIDGSVTTSGVTYQWYQDGTIISSNGTSQNLTVTGTMGLSHLYTCTCTWT